MFCPNCGSFIETIGRTGLINFPRSCISCGHSLQTAQEKEGRKGFKQSLFLAFIVFAIISVSYTHLTLPTIYSV